MMFTSDDVTQDLALQQLLHPEKTYSKAIIALKLQTREHRPVIDMPFEEVPGLTDDRAIGPAEELLSWGLDNNCLEKVEWFLEDPETRLEAVAEELGLVLSNKKPKKRKRVKYAEIMRKRLRTPATVEELTREVSVYGIRRPAATVRNFLRRGISRGLLQKNEQTQKYELISQE